MAGPAALRPVAGLRPYARSLALCLTCLGSAVAADAGSPDPAGGAAASPPTGATARGLDPSSPDYIEEKWVFDPPTGRPDPFSDYEKVLELLKGNEQTALPTTGTPQTGETVDETELIRQEGLRELQHVESYMLEHKWDDVLKIADAEVKRLQRHADDPQVFRISEKLKRYRSQADDAKILDEAQAKFDGLGLKIEGILWSPTGSLAVISGEPSACGINDRVKDCTIINIDTNRVDFLYHYNRRRFEFQRYIGEDTGSGVGDASATSK